MPTAFVLSGGGSLGAVQVGMLQALADHRLGPDLLVGASAGAINAAYVAGRGFNHDTLDRLAAVWCSLRRADVFPLAPTVNCSHSSARDPRCAGRARWSGWFAST